MERVIAVYKIGKPISWEEFKKYSPEVQRQYLEWLRDNLGATTSMLEEMFELGKGTFSTWLWKNKLTGILPRNYTESKHRKFKKWLKTDEEKEPKPVEKKEIKPKENPIFYNLISSCDMTLEGSAAQIGETIYQIFKDQKIKVVVTLCNEQKEILEVNGDEKDKRVEDHESDCACYVDNIGCDEHN